MAVCASTARPPTFRQPMRSSTLPALRRASVRAIYRACTTPTATCPHPADPPCTDCDHPPPQSQARAWRFPAPSPFSCRGRLCGVRRCRVRARAAATVPSDDSAAQANPARRSLQSRLPTRLRTPAPPDISAPCRVMMRAAPRGALRVIPQRGHPAQVPPPRHIGPASLHRPTPSPPIRRARWASHNATLPWASPQATG